MSSYEIELLINELLCMNIFMILLQHDNYFFPVQPKAIGSMCVLSATIKICKRKQQKTASNYQTNSFAST